MTTVEKSYVIYVTAKYRSREDAKIDYGHIKSRLKDWYSWSPAISKLSIIDNSKSYIYRDVTWTR